MFLTIVYFPTFGSCTVLHFYVSSDCMHIESMRKLHSYYENTWQECLAEVEQVKVHIGHVFLFHLLDHLI